MRRLPTGPGLDADAAERRPRSGLSEDHQPQVARARRRLIEAIDAKNLVLALGPAGTGKTYLAIAKAVEALEAGRVGRIVLSRPAVEAGELIGFLPGETGGQARPLPAAALRRPLRPPVDEAGAGR